MKLPMIKACLAMICLLCFADAGAAITVNSESLQLQFSDRGDLVSATACFPACELHDSKTRILSGENGMLVFGQNQRGSLQLHKQQQDASTILMFSGSSGHVLRRWTIPDKGWLITVESSAGDSATLSSGNDFRPAPSSGFGDLLEQTRYLVFEDTAVETIGLDEAGPVERQSAGWLGFRNRFWTAMVLPESTLDIKMDSGDMVRDARVELISSTGEFALDIYLGPIEPTALSHSAAELESLMYSGLWFWLRWICQALYFLLNAIAMLIPQWGLAVMVLSLVVGTLMRPLSKIADRLQDQVHEIDARLAPTLTSIKKNYKGAEQSEKILAMYKSENVHPLYSLKSLAGVFVVIPVFIGAFDMLAENIHLSGVSFLWIADLSHQDAFMRLPFELPFFGAYLNLLPFIMTGFSFIASRMHSHPAMDVAQRRKHSRNLVLMSLGFLVLFYTFPAGMVLYWTTNNLISVIKTVWKKRKLANG